MFEQNANVRTSLGGAGRQRRSGDRKTGPEVPARIPGLSARAFSLSGDDTIELVLRSDGDYTGDVRIEGVGDDGSSEDLLLESAEIIGLGLADVEQNKIKNIRLAAAEAVRLRVRLRKPGKYAIRATLA